jgi:hypothetical protein
MKISGEGSSVLGGISRELLALFKFLFANGYGNFSASVLQICLKICFIKV